VVAGQRLGLAQGADVVAPRLRLEADQIVPAERLEPAVHRPAGGVVQVGGPLFGLGVVALEGGAPADFLGAVGAVGVGAVHALQLAAVRQVQDHHAAPFQPAGGGVGVQGQHRLPVLGGDAAGRL